MQELIITGRVHAELLAHSRRQAPAEAVAFLSGTRPDITTDFAPLPNMVAGHGFLVHPRDQFDALMSIRRQGQMLIGTFHSHPEGAPALSDTDMQYLERWKCLHVVASIWQKVERADEIAAFAINGNRWLAVTVRVNY